MKPWMLLPCLLVGTVLVAQTNSVTETNLPAATPQTSVPVPAMQANGSVPAGTALMVRLDTTLATFSNKAGDPFRAIITQPVVVNGQTLIPAGSTVEGRVTKVTEPRRISGRPTIGILPEAVILPTGERYYLDATRAGWRRRRRHVDRRTGRWPGRSPGWRRNRSRWHYWPLAWQASFRSSACRHRTHAGIESTHDDDEFRDRDSGSESTGSDRWQQVIDLAA